MLTVDKCWPNKGPIPVKAENVTWDGIEYEDKDSEAEASDMAKFDKYIQWSTNGKLFVPCNETKPRLRPAAYEIGVSEQLGLYFEEIPVKTEELIPFPDANSDKVISEIRNFWTKKEKFVKQKLPFKRGILLYGPPGGGKSCTIKFVMKDVIDRNGVVLMFESPDHFTDGMRILRQIEPDVPVVVVMENVDALLEDYNESDILNILDGVESIENVVFVASTNYPEKLNERVAARPSRFDKRFKIEMPSGEARKVYLEHLFRETPDHGFDLDKWVKDSEGFSIAHLKELFVAVTILGNDYDEALGTLEEMFVKISSEHDYAEAVGFGGAVDAAKKGLKCVKKRK